MSPRRSPPLVALSLLSMLACATAGSARREELRRRLDEARVVQSPAEVWPKVQRFAAERGYTLVGDDRVAVGQPAQGTVGRLFSVGRQTWVKADGSRFLETELDDRTRTRLRLEATAVPGGGSRLRVTRLEQKDMNHTEYNEWRDEELEVALLTKVDPFVAAKVLGTEVSPQAAEAAAKPDAWTPVRPIVGTWEGTLPGGVKVRWRFDFVEAGQFVEVHGTQLLFAGPAAAPASSAEEMGRMSRDAAADRIVWHQFTSGGRVDRYRSEPPAPGALVFVADAPESLPAGSRVRLTLGRDGDEEMLAILQIAEPGKDLAVAGEVRLKRAR